MKRVIVPAIILLLTIQFAEGSGAVDFVTNIEMMKGHLHASILNKEAGNNDLAKAHAGHPIEELYTLIREELENKDPSFANQLESKLLELFNNVDKLSIDEYRIEVMETNEMLDEAIEKVVDEEADDPKFITQVITNLLEEAEHEYEEGVEVEGEIANIVEYQDASGFIHRAEELFNSIKRELEENVMKELELSFERLNDVIEEIGSIDELESVVKSIVNEFNEWLGIEVEEEKPTIAEIRLMLDAILDEYEEGEYEEAEELAVKAYLEKYEYLEADIAAVDEELMEETEVMLREELRQLIKDRASIEEIEAKIEEIRANLDKIESLGIGVGKDPRLNYLSNIEALLDKIIEEYEEGKYEEAERLIIEAYLDNYELIESDVKSYDEALNEDVEHLLTVELASKIKNKASIDEIKATVDTIKAKLDIIETQVIPEFPIAIIALATIMSILVAVTRSKLNIF